MDDYNSCCRLCLSSHESNLDLFGSHCLKEMIPHKVLCILSILVHPQDTLPQKICPQCFDHVKRFYKFHRTSSCSNDHLLTFLENDEDVNKNIYANLQKTFHRKNYSNLSGNSNYELLLQEKFNEVKNSMNEVTSKFSNANTVELIPNKIYLFESGNKANINMIGINTIELPDSNLSPLPVTNKNVTHPTNYTPNVKKYSSSRKGLSKPIVNNKQREAEDELLDSKIKCDIVSSNEICSDENKPLIKRVRPKKKIDEEPLEERLIELVKKDSLNTEKCNVETKVVSLKIFRCKYCQCAYPKKRETFHHEATDHKITVKLNKYYGTDNLKLEQDYINQIKKLSWPFRKKRSGVAMKRKSTLPQSSPQIDIKTSLPSVKKISLGVEDVSLPSRLNAEEIEIPTKKMRMSTNCEKNTLKSSDQNKKVESIDTSNSNVSTNKKRFVGPKSKKEKRLKKYIEYQCKYCKCQLNSLSSKVFLAHLGLKKCNNVTKFTCCLCREDFSNKTELFEKHKKDCNMSKFKKEHLCSICSSSIEKEALQNHLIDQHQTLFKCFICSAEFNQKDCLSDHLMKCTFQPTIVKTYSCETCIEKFPSLISLKEHHLKEHTYNYLNCDVSLDYLNIFDTMKKEKTLNVLQYKIDNYLACNSKGTFYCGIKDCKKVLGTIFQLESHIQSHCNTVKKRGTKRKRGGWKSNFKIKTQNYHTAICDDFLSKKAEIEPLSSLEENLVEMKPKESFLFYLGLTHNPERQEKFVLDVLTCVFRNNPDSMSSSDPQGIFELSESAKTSKRDLLVWESNEGKGPLSPEVVTIDSDDD